MDFSAAYGMLCAVLAELCVEHSYLLDSERVTSYDKVLLSHLVHTEGNPTEVKKSLHTLLRALYAHLDEYFGFTQADVDRLLKDADARGRNRKMTMTKSCFMAFPSSEKGVRSRKSIPKKAVRRNHREENCCKRGKRKEAALSLQFITGSSGCGKSHDIYEKIIRESMKHPEKRYLFLVPDQDTLQTERELLALHPRKTLLNIDVLSFNRLAYRVFGEVGGDRRPILEETGKSLVLQKVAWDQRKNLKVLGSALKRPGTVSQMKSLVSELMQYQVEPKDLDKWLPSQENRRLLAWKLEDVKTIYQGFSDYLKERYLTAEELPEILCGVIGGSRLLRGSTLVLDGFTGFTPVQNKVLQEMCSLCEKIYVLVTLDQREGLTGRMEAHRLFYMSRQMIRQLTDMAHQRGREVEETLWISAGAGSRFANNEALRFLEENLFRYGSASYGKDQDSLFIHEAENPAGELTHAAEVILRLVRQKGYRYRDFAIVTGDLEAYGREAETLLEEAGIPYFIDQKHGVTDNPLVEYVRAALELLVKNFSYESVFRYLRSGLTDFTGDEIDRMENYVLALGIRGWKQYKERWVRVPRSLDPEELGALNDLRQRFCDSLSAYVEGMRDRTATAGRRTEVLYQLLAQGQIQQKLKAYENRFHQEGRAALEKEYSQIYGKLMSLLDKLVEVLGQEYTPMSAYQQLLEAGFQETQVGLIPPGIDQVLVGDMERTRLKNIKVLFLVGVNETIIPKPVKKGGILSEPDREFLKSQSADLAPTAREEMYRQRFYLYLSLTKPSDLLYLSYSRTDAAGTARGPAYLIAMIQRMFPGLSIGQAGGEETWRERLETPLGERELLLQGLRQLRDREPDPEFLELCRWRQLSPKGRRELSWLLQAAFYANPQTGIGRAAAQAVYGKVLTNSATRLEKFASCAFAHFLQYGLRLQERERYEFNAADLGNVMHAALERFYHNLTRQGYQWGALEEDQRVRLADQALEEVVHDYGNTILHSSHRNEGQIKRVQSLLQCTVWALQEQIRRGRFTPGGAEMAFGGGEELQAVNISLSEEERIRLRGRIDRLDLCQTPEKLYVKIIDYKTGNVSMDLLQFYHGTQLQLAVYLNAALELTQKKHPHQVVEPAGVYYYHIKDPYITVSSLKAGKDPEAILRELRLDGLSREEGEILALLDQGLEPKTSSSVIPVGMTRDGKLTAYSKAAGEENFQLICQYTDWKIRQLGKQMMEGDTSIAPIRTDSKDGCQYCPYKGVCSFDEKIPGFSYRRRKKTSDAALLEAMRRELGLAEESPDQETGQEEQEGSGAGGKEPEEKKGSGAGGKAPEEKKGSGEGRKEPEEEKGSGEGRKEPEEEKGSGEDRKIQARGEERL